MSYSNIIGWILVICLSNLYNIVSSSKCPPPASISPCTCIDQVVIKCAGSDNIDLRQIFKNMSDVLSKDDKKFSTFTLNNTAITDLYNNTFYDITFKRIEIYAKGLQRIHADAFAEYNTESIEQFHQFGNSNLGGDQYSDEVFTALSSLVNVQEISFEETHLNRLQSHAFRMRSGAQTHLSSIDFGGKAFGEAKDNLQIQVVGNYSFYYLQALQSINLQNQKINKIAIHGFDIWKPSTKQMRISLINNKIDDKSIEIGAFSNSKRPLFIELGFNALTYIEERIFGPVLRLNNQTLIYFDKNPFVCDCRMNWLRKERIYYENQVKYIVCQNYKRIDGNLTNFWDISEKEFLSCVE